MQIDNTSPCRQCNRYFKNETLAKRDGICGYCVRRNLHPKIACLNCGDEHLAETLKDNDGLCLKCYRQKLRIEGISCTECNTKFLKQQLDDNGRCNYCSLREDREDRGLLQRSIEYNKSLSIKPQNATHCLSFSRMKQNECIICLETFQDDDQISILSCVHYFHKKCIEDWFIAQKSKKCPICRDDTNSVIPEAVRPVIPEIVRPVIPQAVIPEVARPEIFVIPVRPVRPEVVRSEIFVIPEAVIPQAVRPEAVRQNSIEHRRCSKISMTINRIINYLKH